MIKDSAKEIAKVMIKVSTNATMVSTTVILAIGIPITTVVTVDLAAGTSTIITMLGVTVVSTMTVLVGTTTMTTVAGKTGMVTVGAAISETVTLTDTLAAVTLETAVSEIETSETATLEIETLETATLEIETLETADSEIVTSAEIVMLVAEARVAIAVAPGTWVVGARLAEAKEEVLVGAKALAEGEALVGAEA
jgi:hypothetical protein